MGTKPINNNATFFFLVVLLSYASLGLSLQQTTIDDLQYYKRLLLTAVVGPESLAFDRDGGGPYTGASDGRIIKWHGMDRGWADFAVPSWNRDQECNGGHYLLTEKICGRPLGLQFYGATGELFVADSTFGLLRIDREGGLATIIANEAEGVPFHFTNGLDVDQENGMVYFTDSSTTFFRR
ncbi:hypothetical protein QJS04_geneDACA017142 [Acorus gramineus]|uniref:Adipocyte plasma membrane-associated protein n=1 Tax=Acorus gramineus TaxID=55184 RepID=A0AAV9BP55_ACOGR|nr:hypothetical protein QJS04_geneDACA017142 [Acorus gramineus]